tara:strand:+ start:1021 stop:1242 length:222 start_codon:yes stop_codon:yes gene_type:complete
MWNDYFALVSGAVLAAAVGVVDQIHGGTATVEVESMTYYLPLWVFPCEVKEGTQFYYTKQENMFRLQCGKPGE